MENVTGNTVENMQKNTGGKKIIFGVFILCLLIIMAMTNYLFVSPGKPARKNQDQVPVISPSSPSVPKFSYKQKIIVNNQGFDPSTIKVKINTLVSWINQSGQEVALVSNPPPTHDAYPGLNQGRFPDGNGVSVVFDKAGTYEYYNYLHSEQTGTIIVE